MFWKKGFFQGLCLSGTASKQRTSKATHDLTELAVPTLLPLQCLPLPHLTVTKTPRGLSLFSNLKTQAQLCSAECILQKNTSGPRQKERSFLREKWYRANERQDIHRWPCPNFSRHSTLCSEEDKQDTVSQETGSAAASVTVSVWPGAWFALPL